MNLNGCNPQQSALAFNPQNPFIKWCAVISIVWNWYTEKIDHFFGVWEHHCMYVYAHVVVVCVPVFYLRERW